MKKEHVQIETITPEQASKILSEQETRIAKGVYRQRTLNEDTINRYATDMRHGHWLLNNQGIGFDENGNLVDGRHRLWAVKQSGVSIRTLVLRGLLPVQRNGITVNTIDTVDCGRNRTVAQQLMLDGVANGGVQSASARVIALLCSGDIHLKMSVTQVRCILDIYGVGIRKTIVNLHSSPRLTRGFFVGPVAMYRAFKSQEADAFSMRYQAMVNLEHGSPIIALQKCLQNISVRGKDGVQNAMNAVSLALRHHDEGTKVNALRKSPLGSDWLLDNQKNNVRKVREILGLK